MNQAVFLIDANHATAGCVKAIKQLRAVYHASRLIVVGNHPQVDVWESLAGEEGDRIETPSRLRTGANLALFGMVAADLLHDPGIQYWEWWLIGNLRALDEIATRARARGVDAEAYESLTPDEVYARVEQRGSYAQSMRELFVELQAAANGAPVHVGSLAEEAISRWPELRQHELRRVLFGGKKFSRIADEIGLIRERYKLLRLANPDSVAHVP